MELYRLKGFAAIAREGNLTRAAERLHLSQSALSNQLKLLEEELGLVLFRRTSRGMELTEGGRQLRSLVDEVLEGAERLSRRAHELRSVGETLNIGLHTDPGFLRVGELNRRLSLLLGSVNVVFHNCPSVRIAKQLRQGLLDLAFRYGDAAEPGLRQLRLAAVPFCIVLPSSLDVRPGTWQEAAVLPWVWVEKDSPPYRAVQAEFERRHLVPRKVVQTVDEYIVKELVEEGQGLAVMREDEARPLAEAGKVAIWERGWLHLPLSLVWEEQRGEAMTVRLAREGVEQVWRGSLEEEGEGHRYWY